MRKYVIMGPQGSGKGTQAKLLCRDYDLIHIGTGDLLRWHAQNHTRLGAQVKRMVTAGQLVPDELMQEIVRERLDQHDWNYGFVLDGFPRNVAQSRYFTERWDVDAVVLVDVPDPVVIERALARRQCSQCGLDYNLLHHRPAVADTCDACRGRLVARADDTPEGLRARLGDYHGQTRPVLELFAQKERLLCVDGTRPIEVIQAEIRQRLGLPLRAAA